MKKPLVPFPGIEPGASRDGIPRHMLNPCNGISGVYAPRLRVYCFAAVQKFTPRLFSAKTSRAMSSASPFQLPLMSVRSS